jgi:hypothetical protein
MRKSLRQISPGKTIEDARDEELTRLTKMGRVDLLQRYDLPDTEVERALDTNMDYKFSFPGKVVSQVHKILELSGNQRY